LLKTFSFFHIYKNDWGKNIFFTFSPLKIKSWIRIRIWIRIGLQNPGFRSAWNGCGSETLLLIVSHLSNFYDVPLLIGCWIQRAHRLDCHSTEGSQREAGAHLHASDCRPPESSAGNSNFSLIDPDHVMRIRIGIMRFNNDRFRILRLNFGSDLTFLFHFYYTRAIDVIKRPLQDTVTFIQSFQGFVFIRKKSWNLIIAGQFSGSARIQNYLASGGRDPDPRIGFWSSPLFTQNLKTSFLKCIEKWANSS